MNLEFRKYIKAVGTGQKLSRDLTPEEADRAFRLVMNGEASDAQIGALLVPLRMKGESGDEVAVFVRTVRDFCILRDTGLPHFVDCGVAYDGKIKSPHISPAAAFVAAGAGAAVLLHGQSQTPPKYGVSVRDVFVELGLRVDLNAVQTCEILKETGVGFLSIENICPRLAELKRIREELGLRTVFNHIEKIWNPLNAPHQVISVYHGPYLKTIPQVMLKLKAGHVLVIQGMEGTPDCRVNRVTRMAEITGEKLSERTLDPAALGLEGGPDPAVEPLTARDNAAFVESCLRDATGPYRAGAMLNGAVLIYASGLAGDMEEALERSKESLDSSRALNKLDALRNILRQIT